MEHYFVGMAISPGAGVETGVAVIDKNNEIIMVDKLFSIQDIQHFFDNFSSLNDSQICVSLPWENTMINGKWRIQSKPYQLVMSNDNFKNTDNWMQRYSNRGSDYLNTLIEKGAKINRFELYLTRQCLGLDTCYKERSPADCKALQNALKLKYGFSNIPSNMMPMSQLEAITGAVLAKKYSDQKQDMPALFEFNGVKVIRG
jgi:hypothetical protein